jgi:hypothetical protein
MNTPQIHLFVQEGCRPCHYVKTQLSKVEGWEDIVTFKSRLHHYLEKMTT